MRLGCQGAKGIKLLSIQSENHEGPPGTGKTLLAKAVANKTSATFLRLVGSELIQKHAGEGPRMVREIFKLADLYSPSIIFLDEIDAVGSKRGYQGSSSGEKEVERTMLELLNQLDGFDARPEIKIIMATNRIDCLDAALIRPGRIDRKIEIPLPDEKNKMKIFAIHTDRMSLSPGMNFDKMAREELSGAEIKAICSEAGLLALRDRRRMVTGEDFEKAHETVMLRKTESRFQNMFL